MGEDEVEVIGDSEDGVYLKDDCSLGVDSGGYARVLLGIVRLGMVLEIPLVQQLRLARLGITGRGGASTLGRSGVRRLDPLQTRLVWSLLVNLNLPATANVWAG